jgi:hypothetical protein
VDERAEERRDADLVEGSGDERVVVLEGLAGVRVPRDAPTVLAAPI